MPIKNILLLIFCSSIIFSCGENTDSKEVLFVCTHGAARSPIAAAYFNKLAKEKDLNYHAVFRGTKPDEVLTKETIAGLSTDGIEIDGWKPSIVTVSDIERAYKVVTFDCTLPANDLANLDEVQWNGTPSISKDYGIARNSIKEKVEELVNSLSKK